MEADGRRAIAVLHAGVVSEMRTKRATQKVVILAKAGIE
jgi:hypothetical protein